MVLPLVLVRRPCVRVTDRLVGDQHHPTRAQRLPGDPERLHRTGQIVQHLEHRRDVVAGPGKRGRVPNLERHPVRHTLGHGHRRAASIEPGSRSTPSTVTPG